MFIDKKNYKDAANEDNFKVELFIDKATGRLTYRNALGQKVFLSTFMEETPKPKTDTETRA